MHLFQMVVLRTVTMCMQDELSACNTQVLHMPAASIQQYQAHQGGGAVHRDTQVCCDVAEAAELILSSRRHTHHEQ